MNGLSEPSWWVQAEKRISSLVMGLDLHNNAFLPLAFMPLTEGNEKLQGISMYARRAEKKKKEKRKMNKDIQKSNQTIALADV